MQINFIIDLFQMRFTLKAMVCCCWWFADESRCEYDPVRVQRGIYSSPRLWHRAKFAFSIVPAHHYGCARNWNELQFVNGGKFEHVLDFRPTIMKLERINWNSCRLLFYVKWCKFQLTTGLVWKMSHRTTAPRERIVEYIFIHKAYLLPIYNLHNIQKMLWLIIIIIIIHHPSSRATLFTRGIRLRYLSSAMSGQDIASYTGRFRLYTNS